MSALMAVIWPSIQDSMDRLMDSYPTGLKEAFGIERLDSLEHYVDAEMLSLIVPLALAFFAVRCVAAPTVGAEERGHLDALLALPLPRRVLVSAGGTREPLDSVRFVGNRSSGRMGVALAEEARSRGADVTLLAANLGVAPPAGVTVVDTPTAADLEREALSRSDADVLVMAAAVADYRPAKPRADKRPKDEERWTVELEPTRDVLAALGAERRAGQVLVGFAADGAGSGLERAREKRIAKRADLFVFNDVSRPDIGFDVDENEVVIVSEAGEREVAKGPKREIAAAVLDEVERLLSER